MACGHYDWIERVRILELENQRLMSCQEATLKDTNRKLLLYLTELQNLRQKSEYLSQENEELKKLCCFLDQDREEMKETLEEWKRFGNQANSFLQNEVSVYKEKLQILEQRQTEILAENQFLQEIVATGSLKSIHDFSKASSNSSTETPRDAGDGSSETECTDVFYDLTPRKEDANGISYDDGRKYVPSTRPKWSSSLPRYISQKRSMPVDTATCVLEFVKSLEYRLRKLEETKKTVSPQAHVMQTSMSAPELEIVCRNGEQENETCQWSENEKILKIGESDTADFRIHKNVPYRKWNSVIVRETVESAIGRSGQNGTEGRNCSAA